ncbi:MAG: hypothetical protein ACPGVN_01100 [Alphaproteobacteria bacterium]
MFKRISSFILAFSILALTSFSISAQERFQRIPTQFIAALGDPNASSGTGAENWGRWHVDPGPRGVWLRDFNILAGGGFGPGGWSFDKEDWWLDENGLIMEKPTFPMDAGTYVVTGDREVVTTMTIHPADENGEQKWELGGNARLFDVTHLPCRSARYSPAAAGESCSPANAPQSAFKVSPGAKMPAVPGCQKQDYAVLFIVGVPISQAEVDTSPE